MPELHSFLIGTSGLGTLLLAAGSLSAARPAPSSVFLVSLKRAGGLALLFQVGHFSEELANGFHHRFPALWGLSPWPVSWFVVLNLFWIVVWTVSIPRLGSNPWAIFPVWFLGLASLANSVVHPVLSLVASGYFPGLGTAPASGVAGFLLVLALTRATARRCD